MPNGELRTGLLEHQGRRGPSARARTTTRPVAPVHPAGERAGSAPEDAR